MPINYESAWKQLKTFVSDMEGYSKLYSSIGFKAVLLKMEELEKALTTDEADTSVELDSEEFSLNVFDETAKILSGQKLYTDVINQFVDEKTKDVDRIVFDCFQQYLGCKKADDVFMIMTSPVMFHNYNDILPCINARLEREVGPLGSPSGVHCIKLGEMTEPATRSHEMLETLRTRWEEIYNEN